MKRLLFFFILFTVLLFLAALKVETNHKQRDVEKNSRAKPDDVMGENFRMLWNSKFQGKIDRDIEKYRKGNALIKITDKKGNPIEGVRVTIRQQTHDFLFGCNLFVLHQLETPELNKKYENAFVNLFNFATLPFYWRDLEPQEGIPRFGEDSPRIWRRPPPDLLVKWCETHNIIAKGHALMYNRNIFMPDWTEQNDPELFMKQAKTHVEGIANRYKDNIAVWDVVNEERYRTKNLNTGHKVPDDYLIRCFKVANSLFPDNVKLLYNDDTQSHDCPEEYRRYVNTVLESGSRIDGMGIQFHLFDLESRDKFIEGNLYSPLQLINAYDQFARTGLPLYITEITVPGSGENGDKIQAEIVKNLYRLWFSIPNMGGITWWNLGDGTAYGDEDKALAGLLDKNMDPKPAYNVLDSLINNEWKTCLTAKSDETGVIKFRGFWGSYRICWENQLGEKQEAKFYLKEDGDRLYLTE